MATLRALTWNIWGLNEEHLLARTKAVAAEIAALGVDVAMLQEIVSSTEAPLRRALLIAGYSLIVPPAERRFPYYVGIAVRDATAAVEGVVVDDFPGSNMRRHVLSVRCRLRASGLEVDAMTAHFESEGNKRERQAQALRTVELMSRSTSHLAVFGGDTNLREDEAPVVGGRVRRRASPLLMR